MKLTSNFNVKEIRKYRRTHTLKETGKKFGVTPERIRQIELLVHRKWCGKHKRFYFNKCSYCLNEKYKDWIQKLGSKIIIIEAGKEALNRKRDYFSVQRKVSLINVLYYQHGKSLLEIAKLLNRDYTTITHLFKTYILQKNESK